MGTRSVSQNRDPFTKRASLSLSFSRRTQTIHAIHGWSLCDLWLAAASHSYLTDGLFTSKNVHMPHVYFGTPTKRY